MELLEVDTSKILFIASGAFVGLDSQSKTNTIGFGNNTHSDHVLVSEELNKFGLIPEFIGRFPIVFRTEDLTKQEMKQVLTQIDNNLLEQSKFYFELDNIQLEFSDKALDKIVDLALQYKVGARALKGIVEATLLEYHFEADQLSGSTIKIDEENIQEV